MSNYRISDGTEKTKAEVIALHPNVSIPKVWDAEVLTTLDVDVIFESAKSTPSGTYKIVVRDGIEQDAKDNWVEKWVEQAETTTYMPLPNIFGIDMGLNDQIGMIQNSSVSFGNTIALYAKILQDTWNFLAQSEKAYYQKKSGPYPWKEKGDLKLISDFMRVFGFTGNTFDTETALKNIERSKERR